MTRAPDAEPLGPLQTADEILAVHGDVTQAPAAARVDVAIEDDGWERHGIDMEGLVQRAALTVLRDASVSVRETGAPVPAHAGLCVVLSNDAGVAELNAQFRETPKPTNVLSFPSGALEAAGMDVDVSMGDAAGFPGTADMLRELGLGDVVLARETVAREALTAGVAMADHVTHLVIHATLHLLGYDHETDDEADVMEALETRLLSGLGIADPYAAAGEAQPVASGTVPSHETLFK